MSGPKYYDFNLGSPEEAAGVMAQLSACGMGVRAHVSGNEIKFTVSEAAWYRGATYSEISSRIEQAKKNYAENERLKRILKERKEEEAKVLIKNCTDEVEEDYKEEKKKIEAARAEVAKLRREAQFSVRTPFGDYDLGDTKARVEEAEGKLRTDAENLEKSKQKALDKIDEAEREIAACESLGAYDACVSKAKSASVKSVSSPAVVEELSATVREKTAKLKRYKEATDKLYSGLEKAGLKGYLERVKSELSSVDVFSDGAADKVKAVLAQIEKEVSVIKERQADDARNSEIASGVKQTVAALEELGNLLKTDAEQGVSESVTAADYTERSGEAVKEIERILSKIKDLEFINGENKGVIERIKNDYAPCKNSLASKTTFEKLQKILATLRTVEKDCEKVNGIYLDFKREYDRYESLYVKAQGFLSTADAKGKDDESANLPSPVEITLAYDNPEKKIEELKERNDELEKEIAKCEQEAVCAAIGAATSKGKAGKKFRKERTADGSLHFTFVREDAKGVIFDVDCKEGGKVGIYPRGVILCNGKSMATKEQLEATYSSCKYADDIHDSLTSFGLTDGGSYAEMPEEVKRSMYDEKNFYRIDSFDESVRYLRLNGCSEERINEILEVETGDEEERKKKRAAVASAQKAIKPQ